MASWLNVFVRQADVVDIACIAQSVNVISPLITSPTGLFKQTIYYPLYLFSQYMRGGVSVRVSSTSPTFAEETLPKWISDIKGHPQELDVSAVLQTNETGARSLRIAVVNRDEKSSHEVPIRIAFEDAVGKRVEVHELWHKDVRARNSWEKQEVGVLSRTETWKEKWTFREHSFTMLVLDL